MNATTTEAWIIVWFPPEGDRERKFRTEQAAREFASSEHIAAWNPLMERQRVTTSIESELITLNPQLPQSDPNS